MTFVVEGLRQGLETEGQVRRIGEYQTLAEAITAAQRVIDIFLQREYRPGMDAGALFTRYQSDGEAPFIFRNDDKTLNVRGFNHTQYALTRCDEICRRKR